MSIVLEWGEPVSFRDIFVESDITKRYRTPGVYLWMENDGQEGVMNYVGRALGRPNLIQRQRQHYMDMISGRSTIPERYRSNNRDWVPGNEPDFSEVMLSPEKYKNLVDDAFAYLDVIQIQLFALPGIEPSIISLIESKLIYEFKPWCNTRGVKYAPKQDVAIEFVGNWPGCGMQVVQAEPLTWPA